MFSQNNIFHIPRGSKSLGKQVEDLIPYSLEPVMCNKIYFLNLLPGKKLRSLIFDKR